MEIEAKFAILSSRQFQALVKARDLFDYPLGKAHTSQTTDIYFDTPSFQLLRHGFSLRLRHSGEWVATLKSLASEGKQTLHIRFEQEEPLADEFDYVAPRALALAHLPATIQRLVALAIGTQDELQPLFKLLQARTKRSLFAPLPSHSTKREPPLSEATDELAEVSIDHVEVWSTTADPKQVAHFSELEVELRGGSQDQLTALAQQLAANSALRPNRESKFARALPLLAAEPSHDAMTSAAEYCRSIWSKQLIQLLLQEDGVRSNQVEAVHDMRVAIRRMRAAAKLFAGQFRKKAVKTFLKRLRRTAHLLGTVRDLDVALARLAAEHGEGHENDQLAPLREAWQKKRKKAHLQLVEWLNSERYACFIDEFLSFCQRRDAGTKAFSTAKGSPPTPVQLRHLLPPLLLERFTTVRTFETVLLTDEKVPLATWHALRIECKYLRYALEFAEPFFGNEGSRLIEQLKQLQETLGNLNDAAVSKRMLTARKAQTEAEAAYQKHQHDVIEEEVARASDAFRSFVSPAQRRLLHQALVNL